SGASATPRAEASRRSLASVMLDGLAGGIHYATRRRRPLLALRQPDRIGPLDHLLARIRRSPRLRTTGGGARDICRSSRQGRCNAYNYLSNSREFFSGLPFAPP